MSQSDNSEAGIRLRAMESADVTFLSDLWVDSWREAMPDIDFAARRAWLVGFLATPGIETIVAADAGGLCGFLACEGDVLHQLVVAVTHKGTGAAQRLLGACMARSPAGLRLEVNQDNPRAIAFYRRAGFAIEAAGRNPRSGLATWHMRRRGA